jgi:hypothetical protein
MIIPPKLRSPLLKLGRRPAAVVPFAFVKRPHGIAAVLTRLLPRVHPRVTVKPLEPVLAREVDDIAPVGRIAELHPHMPDSRRLEKLLATGIGECPTDGHQLTAVGRAEPLKRLGRSVQLSPLRVGHLQHLLPPCRQRLAAHGDIAGRTQRRDRRVEFLRVLTDIGF